MASNFQRLSLKISIYAFFRPWYSNKSLKRRICRLAGLAKRTWKSRPRTSLRSHMGPGYKSRSTKLEGETNIQPPHPTSTAADSTEIGQGKKSPTWAKEGKVGSGWCAFETRTRGCTFRQRVVYLCLSLCVDDYPFVTLSYFLVAMESMQIFTETGKKCPEFHGVDHSKRRLIIQTGLGGLWGSLKLLDGWGLALLPSFQKVHDCLPVSWKMHNDSQPLAVQILKGEVVGHDLATRLT